MTQAETTSSPVDAIDESTSSKLTDLCDLVSHLRELLILEWSVVDSSDGSHWLRPSVSRNLDTAKRAVAEKLNAIEALLAETHAAEVLLDEMRLAA
jgi:hypothetical protein